MTIVKMNIALRIVPAVIIFLMTVSGSEGGDIRKSPDEEQSGKPFSVKVNVDMVPVDVSVWGKDVPELRAEDFILYDNEVSQEINYFLRNQIPIAIALLVDCSSSINNYLSSLEIAAISALQKLNPDDLVALFSFNKNNKKQCDLTTDRLIIANKIGMLKASGETDIYKALCDAARYLKKNAPDNRRTIILISDNYQCHSKEKDLKELLETATTLYNIVPPRGYAPAACIDSDNIIRKYAEETGGEVWDVGEGQYFKLALGEAIKKIRMQYTLGFYPTDPGKNGSLHKLDIRFSDDESCPGCKIKARKSYYAGMHNLSIPTNKKPSVSPDSPLNTDLALIQRIIQLAGNAPMDIEEIPFVLTTSEQTGTKGEPLLKVDLKIDAAGIRYTRQEEERKYKIIVAAFYADQHGKSLNFDWWKIDKKLDEEEYSRAGECGVPLSVTIPIKFKTQIVRIVIYDETAGTIGSKRIQLPK